MVGRLQSCGGLGRQSLGVGKVPCVPVDWYHLELLYGLGNMVGKTVKVDEHTLKTERGQFAKVVVSVDLTKPLEGHSLDECVSQPANRATSDPNASVTHAAEPAASTAEPSLAVPPTRKLVVREWMVVPPRALRPPRNRPTVTKPGPNAMNADCDLSAASCINEAEDMETCGEIVAEDVEMKLRDAPTPPEYPQGPVSHFRGGYFARLDRRLCNDAWLRHFPYSSEVHLPQICSDHRPILLRIQGSDVENRRQKEFGFQAAWTLHPEFKSLIKDSWGPVLNFVEAKEGA
ncbi:hypothetical protein Tsubulata_045261 [Turnera subulata]|uniref:Endonuclease/exonuclease/phosphatase domain-containing protein n=1 Tax=Turnera subulata TaxID=218843 RepID=A0A9Q0JJW7_9ROSI|nr:hypothetical protein Tsubulata_045261 [Turnera subulata]